MLMNIVFDFTVAKSLKSRDFILHLLEAEVQQTI